MINPINILGWNIRGTSQAASQRFLHKMCFQNAMWMLVLLEPMTDVVQLDSITRRLRFSSSQAFWDGKIWIFRNENLSIVISERGKQLVHIEVT